MKATQVLLLGGLQVDEQKRAVSAADRITSAWLVDEGSALPLGGCVLFVELEADAGSPKEQLVRVSVEGPPGLLVLMNGEVPFAAAEDDRRRATLILDLDGVGLKQAGTYVFRVHAGNDECASLTLPAAVLVGKVRVRFGSPADGALPFTLFTEDGGFGGYLVADIERRSSDGPGGETVVLALPAGYERLARAAGFVAAAERALEVAASGVTAGPAHEVLIELSA